MSHLDYRQAERRARIDEMARAELEARETENDDLPTDAEVDAELARLAPDVEEFEARERAKERESA